MCEPSRLETAEQDIDVLLESLRNTYLLALELPSLWKHDEKWQMVEDARDLLEEFGVDLDG